MESAVCPYPNGIEEDDARCPVCGFRIKLSPPVNEVDNGFPKYDNGQGRRDTD